MNNEELNKIKFEIKELEIKGENLEAQLNEITHKDDKIRSRAVKGIIIFGSLYLTSMIIFPYIVVPSFILLSLSIIPTGIICLNFESKQSKCQKEIKDNNEKLEKLKKQLDELSKNENIDSIPIKTTENKPAILIQPNDNKKTKKTINK